MRIARLFKSGIAKKVVVFTIAAITIVPSLAVMRAQGPQDNRGGVGGFPPRDPCEQLLDVAGQARGLHKQCEPPGISSGVARGDFNGDGYGDLAVGVPYEDLNFVNAPGAVNIIYGSADGLTTNNDQFFEMRDFGLNLVANAHFGWALAAGNFNGDDYSDLAIGVPGYVDGQILVLVGSANGLTTSGGVQLGFAGTRGRVASIEGFGSALAWGDFNGDGFGDLAVGAPGSDVVGESLACFNSFTEDKAGAVSVLYGSSTGLRSFGAQVLYQGGCDPQGTGDLIESNDKFGSSLTAGDFDGDGRTDLVISAPFENFGLINDVADVGIVHVLQGTIDGLSTSTSTFPRMVL